MEEEENQNLLDQFAMAAMQGMNANPELLQVVTSGSILNGDAFSRMAKKAYEQAEAMIGEREWIMKK